jgi:hypothetical protein
MMMKIAIVALVVLVAACEPPPAWEPGDAPLAIYADNDQVWAAMEAGCAAWSMTGLRCERVAYEDAAVIARRGEPTPGATATTKTRVQTDVDMSFEWGYFVTIGDGTLADPADAAHSAAHEVGHLIGIRGHLHDGPALMSSPTTSAVPTTADLDALALAWGEAPWER